MHASSAPGATTFRPRLCAFSIAPTSYPTLPTAIDSVLAEFQDFRKVTALTPEASENRLCDEETFAPGSRQKPLV